MHLAESILNRLIRRKMKTFLRMDEISALPEPLRPGARVSSSGYLLYIHVPFCESLCPYCSFHRCHFEGGLAHRYFIALQQELRLYHQLGFDFKAVYVGGGTPTISMDHLVQTLELTQTLFSVSEISVETNPNHLTPDHLSRLQVAGVKRLSVGVQSFDDQILHSIGRLEKYGRARDIRQRLEKARGIFNTLNIDLIFNIPGQSEASLQQELSIIDDLQTEQVTFYPLMTAPTVESTLKKTLGPVDYHEERRQYFLIIDRMREHYTPSTAWCFSRKANLIDEYIIDYDQYVGVGSSAFGYHNERLHINTFSLEEYIAKLKLNQLPVTRVKSFSSREKQYFFLLRRFFGLSVPQADLNRDLPRQGLARLFPEWQLLQAIGAFRNSEDSVALTDRGKYIWVMAMREFFIAVDTLREQCRPHLPTPTPANLAPAPV